MGGMSTDGRSMMEAARELASRLRAATRTGGMNGLGEHAEQGQADAGDSQRSASARPDDSVVPGLLKHVAAWSWRLLLVAAVAYLLFKIAVALRLLVIP